MLLSIIWTDVLFKGTYWRRNAESRCDGHFPYPRGTTRERSNTSTCTFLLFKIKTLPFHCQYIVDWNFLKTYLWQYPGATRTREDEARLHSVQKTQTLKREKNHNEGRAHGKMPWGGGRAQLRVGQNRTNSGPFIHQLSTVGPMP